MSRTLLDRLAEARAASIEISEFQVDYDCSQKGLADYQQWLAAVRAALRPSGIPLRITTLPSWLSEPAFTKLVDAVDGYVLQVHSFDLTRVGKAPMVCDPEMAREWVAQAAKLGHPFYVALPTYSCLAGYAPDGRSLGTAGDAGSPSWPKGTRVLELTSDPDALAGLVAEWTRERPASLQGLYWYRLPVDGETYNWCWPTLTAVMAGRVPVSKWKVHANSGNPVDLVLCNTGERSETLPRCIRVTWSGSSQLVVADALGDWSSNAESDRVEFRSSSTGKPLRIAPGNSMPLGWIRYREMPPADISFSYEVVR